LSGYRERGPGLKLFSLEIIFEVFQPVRKTYMNVTDGQTDRAETNRQPTYSA